ncbi:MAG: DUF547 domain-containing protein [Bacteroidota bacterium]
MKLHVLVILVWVLFSCCKVQEPTQGKDGFDHLNSLSEQFLEDIKAGNDTKRIQEQLAKLRVEELEGALQTDAQKLAFWINIYNAFILVILNEHPEYYEDKSEFFAKEQLVIAGEKIAFAKIEHGIIRKSQWDKGFGYVRTWFPNSFERRLRVEQPDYRIHFALNCGAKDCPPVAIYTPERLQEQLKKGTQLFLKRSSKYDPDKKEVTVTALFNWFRGDFGGKRGIKKILQEHHIIPDDTKINLTYENYDWTLELDNFISL